VQALLAARGPQEILPHGRLSPAEADFVEGLREFTLGKYSEKGDSAWARLRGRRMAPVLRSCVEVDMGFLWALRGELGNAESAWDREWGEGAPAHEAAWRNLLGLYLAQRRYAKAEGLLN